MKYSWIFVLLLGWGCTTDRKNIPVASGPPGLVYLVMTEAQWKGPLGGMIDSIFSAEMEGLPRKESIFRLRWIDPSRLSDAIRQNRNLIYAITFDHKGPGAGTIRKVFSPETLDSLRRNPELFVLTNRSVYSRGQDVMYLFGNSEADLIQKLVASGTRLSDYFALRERERLTSSLFKSGQMTGITNLLVKNMKCSVKIPFGYKLAQQEKDFLWVRQINRMDDKDVFVARKPYTSQKAFLKDSLIAFRDAVCRKYLFEDPERSDTYLLTETGISYKPVLTREVNFNGQYAVEMRGLWRTNSLTMGGPFVGLATVDEGTGMMYYVEGFTYGPHKSQREIMRELETVIYTFRTSKDLQVSK